MLAGGAPAVPERVGVVVDRDAEPVAQPAVVAAIARRRGGLRRRAALPDVLPLRAIEGQLVLVAVERVLRQRHQRFDDRSAHLERGVLGGQTFHPVADPRSGQPAVRRGDHGGNLDVVVRSRRDVGEQDVQRLIAHLRQRAVHDVDHAVAVADLDLPPVGGLRPDRRLPGGAVRRVGLDPDAHVDGARDGDVVGLRRVAHLDRRRDHVGDGVGAAQDAQRPADERHALHQLLIGGVTENAAGQEAHRLGEDDAGDEAAGLAEDRLGVVVARRLADRRAKNRRGDQEEDGLVPVAGHQPRVPARALQADRHHQQKRRDAVADHAGADRALQVELFVVGAVAQPAEQQVEPDRVGRHGQRQVLVVGVHGNAEDHVAGRDQPLVEDRRVVRRIGRVRRVRRHDRLPVGLPELHECAERPVGPVLHRERDLVGGGIEPHLGVHVDAVPAR